jgi:hypothetical protein
MSAPATNSAMIGGIATNSSVACRGSAGLTLSRLMLRLVCGRPVTVDDRAAAVAVGTGAAGGGGSGVGAITGAGGGVDGTGCGIAANPAGGGSTAR